ncbi:MAG: hypothetical protein ACRDWV_10215 [Acidimicrobiales bacterium]
MVVNAKFDKERSRLMVGAWSVRASWVHASPPHGKQADRDAALLGIRRGLNLLVESDAHPTLVRVEAWEGEPDGSDGIAVVVADDLLVGTATIPLCSCGERGCGNAGVQLAATLPATALPPLIDLLRTMPALAVIPERGHTWLGREEDLPTNFRDQLTGTDAQGHDTGSSP